MKSTNKFIELTNKTKVNAFGRKLFRIRAKAKIQIHQYLSVEKGTLGGWAESLESFKSDSAWIFERAEISIEAKIWGGEIRGGEIRGGEIRGGVIRGGVIWGGEIRGGEIRGGVIRGGVIKGGVIRGGVIRGGEIRGGEIWGGVIRGGEIWGGVIRGGEIWGGEIWGGVWKISPLQINGTRHFFGFSTKTTIKIGCVEGTISEVRKIYKERGKEAGYTPSQIKEYGLYIELAAKWLKLNAKELKEDKK